MFILLYIHQKSHTTMVPFTTDIMLSWVTSQQKSSSLYIEPRCCKHTSSTNKDDITCTMETGQKFLYGVYRSGSLPPSKNRCFTNSSAPSCSKPTPTSLTPFASSVGRRVLIRTAPSRHNCHPNRRRNMMIVVPSSHRDSSGTF